LDDLEFLFVLLLGAVVALVAHAVVPGLSWEAAFILGAVVAPTDPLAAAASFGRIGAPARVKLLAEGEAIINDATALVVYRVAVAAAVSGTFSAPDAVLEFLLSAAGGIVIGVVAGALEVRVLRHLDDTALSIFLTVLFGYGAYIAAEQADVSGVLAAVVAGLYLGWFAHDAFQADTRLSAVAFWGVLDFAANATLFVLLGLQFPVLVDESQRELSLGGLIGAAVLVSPHRRRGAAARRGAAGPRGHRARAPGGRLERGCAARSRWPPRWRSRPRSTAATRSSSSPSS